MSSNNPVDLLFQQIFDEKVLQEASIRLACEQSELFSKSDLTVTEGVSLTEEIEKADNRTTFRGFYQGKDVTVKLVDMPSRLEDRVKFICCLSCWKLSRDPSIGRLIGAGIAPESTSFIRQIFVILDLYTIGSLRKALTDHVMEWKVKLSIARDIVESLKYLHDRHLVQRNITTSSFFIGRNWRAQLCDFSYICHRGSVNKGPFDSADRSFMSPELLLTIDMEPEKSGVYYDISTDIFNFGIILCEMITGRGPSQDFPTREAITHYALDESELVYCILPGCPESLEALCYQCCDSDPRKRPGAAQCLAEIDLIEEEITPLQEISDLQHSGLMTSDDNNKSNDDIISCLSMATAEQPPTHVMMSLSPQAVKTNNATENGTVVTNPFEELLSPEEGKVAPAAAKEGAEALHVKSSPAKPSTGDNVSDSNAGGSGSGGVYSSLLNNLNSLEAAVKAQSSDPLLTSGGLQQYLSGVNEINTKIGLMQSQIDEIRQSVLMLVNHSTGSAGSKVAVQPSNGSSSDLSPGVTETDAESPSQGIALGSSASNAGNGVPVSVNELPPRINPLDYGSVYDIIVNPTTAAAVQLLQDIHRLHTEYDRNIQSLSQLSSPGSREDGATSGPFESIEGGSASAPLMIENQSSNSGVGEGGVPSSGLLLLPDITVPASSEGGDSASVTSGCSSVRPLSMSESIGVEKPAGVVHLTPSGDMGRRRAERATPPATTAASGGRGSVIDFSPFARSSLRAKIDDLKRRTGLTDDQQPQHSSGSPYQYPGDASDDRSEQLSRDLNFFLRVADRYESAQQQMQQQEQRQRRPQSPSARQQQEPQLMRQLSFRSTLTADFSVASGSGGRSVSPPGRGLNPHPLRSSSRERSRERYRRPPSPGDLPRIESFRSSYDEPVEVRWNTNVHDSDWGDYRRGRKRPHIAPGSPSLNQLTTGSSNGSVAGGSVGTTPTAASAASGANNASGGGASSASKYAAPNRKAPVPKQRDRSKSPNKAAGMEPDPNSLFGSPKHPMSVRELSRSYSAASWGSPYFNPSGDRNEG